MARPLSNFYRGRRVLVTGGSGLIGIPLVKYLVQSGAHVSVVTMDPEARLSIIRDREQFSGVVWFRADLTNYTSARNVVEGNDFVFQLAGSKGSTGIGQSKGATFFRTHLSINMNMLKAAAEAKVERYMMTSTVGVYPPAAVYYEDDAWSGPPNKADLYGGWAKRMSELYAEAVSTEYGMENIVIVRPGNCYGPWDDFNPQTGMAVAALIARAVGGENPLKVWGDGSAIRDFTIAEDVSYGMYLALEKAPSLTPINLSCGKGFAVREVVEALMKTLGRSMDTVQFDTTKPTGEVSRVLSIDRAKQLLGFDPSTDLEVGIRGSVEWYQNNRDVAELRFNPFLKA